MIPGQPDCGKTAIAQFVDYLISSVRELIAKLDGMVSAYTVPLDILDSFLPVISGVPRIGRRQVDGHAAMERPS